MLTQDIYARRATLFWGFGIEYLFGNFVTRFLDNMLNWVLVLKNQYWIIFNRLSKTFELYKRNIKGFNLKTLSKGIRNRASSGTRGIAVWLLWF